MKVRRSVQEQATAVRSFTPHYTSHHFTAPHQHCPSIGHLNFNFWRTSSNLRRLTQLGSIFEHRKIHIVSWAKSTRWENYDEMMKNNQKQPMRSWRLRLRMQTEKANSGRACEARSFEAPPEPLIQQGNHRNASQSIESNVQTGLIDEFVAIKLFSSQFHLSTRLPPASSALFKN